MSRRQHVVRTDDKGGMSNPRTLGGGEVVCATADGGGIQAGTVTTIASITINTASNYRRCAVGATVGRIGSAIGPDAPDSGADVFADYWRVSYSARYGVFDPIESPRYPITATDGIPLRDVTWYGVGRGNTSADDGATAEFWIDDNLIRRFFAADGQTVNNEEPIDLRDLNIVLEAGQEFYFRAIAGVWYSYGNRAGGSVGLLGQRGHPDVELEWSDWWLHDG